MLCEGLVKRSHEVTALTTVPHYPSGQVSAEYRGKWIRRSVENEVQVIRVWLPSVNRANFAMRLLQFLCYQVEAVSAGLGLKYDAVIVANPALWVWLPFVYFVSLNASQPYSRA
jgi:colanic acid biosynthesis glycosyl transferase WcaI